MYAPCYCAVLEIMWEQSQYFMYVYNELKAVVAVKPYPAIYYIYAGKFL